MLEKNLGTLLAGLRKRAGLTQRDVAKLLDRGNSTVSAIEQSTSNPSFLRLARHLEALGCTFHDLQNSIDESWATAQRAPQRPIDLGAESTEIVIRGESAEALLQSFAGHLLERAHKKGG